MKLEIPEPLFLIAGFVIILIVIFAGHAPQEQQTAMQGGNNAATPAVATAAQPSTSTEIRPHFETIATIQIVTKENSSANKN